MGELTLLADFGKPFFQNCARISIEDPSLFGIITGMTPRFSEMNKVRVICERLGDYEGFVIASQFRDGRWIYKLSISEDPGTTETYDNWIPEECLELAK